MQGCLLAFMGSGLCLLLGNLLIDRALLRTKELMLGFSNCPMLSTIGDFSSRHSVGKQVVHGWEDLRFWFEYEYPRLARLGMIR